jgi:hypothetical protein
MLTSMASNTDIFSQAAGTGTGRAWVRVATDGSVVTFLGGQGSTTLAPSGTIVVNTRHEIKLVYTLSPDTLTLVVDGVNQSPVARTVEESTGDFYIGVGHTGITNRLSGNVYSATLNGSIYPLTEGAGDTVYDVSGNGNHGTINNASTGTEGAGFWAGRIDGEANALNNNNGFSKRMLFDGVDDDVVLPSDITGQITDVTGATWVGRIMTEDNSLSKQTVFSDFDGASGGNNKGFMIRLSGDDVLVNYLTSGGAWVGRQATAVVNSNTLTHITVTWSGGLTNGAFKIYVNGAQVDDADYSSGSIGAWQKSDSNYTIGARYSTGGVTNRFKGIISDPSFYSEELSSADVLDMYNGDAPDDTNLIAQYEGHGNTDADWVDLVGTNHGTVNGSPALLRIPADTSDPTKDVFGDTLTNPAITDGYNDSETELDAYNIAEGDNPSPATSGHSALDAIESGTEFTSDDSVYNRITSAAEDDRLITFTEDLTGDDKTLAEIYTQNP